MTEQNPDQIVTELRAQIEAAEKETQRGLSRWLRLAQIAVPAVLRAGAAGNVTCREASIELLQILKEKP